MQAATTATLPPSQQSTRKEQHLLQGAWSFLSGRHEVELLIAGSTYAVKFKNGPIYMGTFRLDLSQQPPAMDMLVQEGPERHQWKTARCIYELDGHLLRWCPTEPGSKDRLSAFPAEHHSDYYCTVFRREHS